MNNNSKVAGHSSSEASALELGTLSIRRLLVKYSVPAIIATVLTSLYNIIDSIFIGHGAGPLAIAGLAISFPLMNLVIAFCLLVSVGGATIGSIFLGQKNIEGATDSVNNVMTLCTIHAVIFGGITLIFLDPILIFFGATPETLPYSREFMKVILFGTPVSYIFIGLNNLMRATGHPAKAMISAFISVPINALLAYIFIFRFGWGIRGAATATILSQCCSLVWVMAHFLSRKTFVRLNRHNSWFNPSIVKRIYPIGLSPFLMNVCTCVVVALINYSLLHCEGVDGNMAVGAYGIVNRVVVFFVMVVLGITQGMQPILGYNYGAKNFSRVNTTLKYGIVAGVGITSLGCLIIELFPGTISAMFTDSETLISIATGAFRIMVACFPFVGCQIVIQNYFQSIGKPAYSIFLSLTRQLIFLVPFLVFFPRLFGIVGVWCSMAASDFLAFVLAVVVLIVTSRRWRSAR